jgi:hypothetical protein
MPDLPISGLPAATTPLAGTEELPVVQGGTTDKVTVANLTAGRPMAAGSLAIGGATIGTDALAVTGTSTLGGNVRITGTPTLNAGAALFYNTQSQIKSPANGQIQFLNNAGTNGVTITAAGVLATPILQLGAADAAAPVAQTLTVQSVVAGTTNTAGTNLTIAGSKGTGTGAGGSIIFQVAPAGLTGSTQNALATALTIDSARLATFGGGITLTGNQLFAADNTYDIGASGATRPRHIYAAGDVVAGTSYSMAAAAVVAWASRGRIDMTADGVYRLRNADLSLSVSATVGASNLLTLNGALTSTGNIQANSGNVTAAFSVISNNGGLYPNTTSGPSIRSGTGAPEGVVTAAQGSLWMRTDGGAGTTLYVKESGAGNTGWVAK